MKLAEAIHFCCHAVATPAHLGFSFNTIYFGVVYTPSAGTATAAQAMCCGKGVEAGILAAESILCDYKQ